MSAELTTWADSVARARAAMRKSFEGCMEVAAASFEQIPHDPQNTLSRDTTGKLARFANEAGIPRGTLDQYRYVAAWGGEQLGESTKLIPSFYLARTARTSGKWATGAEFAEFLATTPPPAGAERWTGDALCEYLGKAPSHGRAPHKRSALPRDYNETDAWVKHLVAHRELAEHALMRLDEKLYPAEKPSAPVPTTRKVDVARRCEGLLRKALSTTPEEAHAALMKVRDLLATYDLVADFKIGER